ncbi:hypothetical protein [Undibacterium parvum]|uniref:Uncharacterized protein n=1 Tax=Undibacterium parvum TaxID=401471 RepID=A0A3S9HI74_9BURK|nr:hypothetical protein [Undibacterium parvum]AZP11817.1 hypothetical protein EJN92_07285 [Undibacterium parvum]
METKKKSQKPATRQLEFDFESKVFIRANTIASAKVIDFNLAKRRLNVDIVRENIPASELKQIIENLISRYK